MNDSLQELILGSLGIGVSFFVVFIVYKIIKVKSNENLAMIEKGMNPKEFEHVAKQPKKDSSLKNGLIMVGIAIGIFMGYILNKMIGISDFPAYASMILIFGGGSLLFYHFTVSKENKK